MSERRNTLIFPTIPKRVQSALKALPREELRNLACKNLAQGPEYKKPRIRSAGLCAPSASAGTKPKEPPKPASVTVSYQVVEQNQEAPAPASNAPGTIGTLENPFANRRSGEETPIPAVLVLAKLTDSSGLPLAFKAVSVLCAHVLRHAISWESSHGRRWRGKDENHRPTFRHIHRFGVVRRRRECSGR